MKKIGIFTGTFNPFTKGHLNILQQAEKIFDEVIIAIGDNSGKEKTEIDRLSTLKLQLPRKRVEKFTGFLVDYIDGLKKEGDITIVRGLRNSSDLLYEINYLRVLNDMDPSVKTVFFVCDRKYEHISSTLVRQMESIQEGSASEYIVKPEMFGEADIFTPRIKMSERYNYPKLILNYDLEKVKAHFEEIVKAPYKHQCDGSVVDWIRDDLKNENFISLVFMHLHPMVRDQFLKENIIKVGENTFEFKLPEGLKNSSVDKCLLDWVKMCETNKDKNEDDSWFEFPFLPGYRFKGVKFIPNSTEEDNVISITLKYDELEKL